MVSGSEHESAGDDEKPKESVLVYDNGSYEVEKNEMPSDVKGKGDGQLSTPLVETTTEHGSSPTPKKGIGLRKWKRIKRDAIKVGENRLDTGKMVSPESINPSKRPQVYAEKHQKSDGSVSSSNPLVGGLDFLAMLGESGLSMVPAFDAGTDSENSEGQSSRSSTAASVPKLKHDKTKMRSLSGKKLTHTVQRGQPGKIPTEAVKKPRGEQIKIKEENSHSSLESDSHGSNFIFAHGTHATSNGIGGRSVHYDGENEEVKGGEQDAGDGLQDGYRRDGVGGSDILTEGVFADSYCKLNEENRNNNGSSSNPDPIAESIAYLQSAQEALEKEVLKFKETSSHSVSDAHQKLTDLKQKIQEKIPEQFPSGGGLETAKGCQESEVEYLFKKKIETEVEYLTISRTIQDLWAAAVNLEEQNASVAEQTQIPRNDGNIRNKAAMPMDVEDQANVNRKLMLQKKAWKYTSCFILQLLCFLVTLGFFISQLSLGSSIEIVPT